VLSWLEPHEQGMSLRFSTLGDHDWADPTTVARGEDWFVNWADFPSVEPITQSLWAAHWLVRQPENRPRTPYAYDVSIAISEDAGVTWGEPLSPHTDDTPTEHGFVSLYPAGAGVGALWLDGRNMTADGGAMTLRSAVINPEGQLHARLTSEGLVDPLVCDCCQTDVAVGSKGPVAVYRDRSILSTEEIRDIHVSRLVDGSWQPGTPVADDGWRISGCPVNGPAIDANGAHVAVAWFTGANDKPRVRLVHSVDGGGHFSEPADISGIRPMGRVDVVAMADGGAVVSWLRRSTPQEAELCVREVSADGALGPVHVIARTATARPSGFPQLQRQGRRLIAAWTDVSGELSEIRTARLDLRPR